jgi:predicted N-formylglutamate amidohydrolase
MAHHRCCSQPGSHRWVPANKQLQRTVIQHRGDTASAPFHYALAVRFTQRRAAAELRR